MSSVSKSAGAVPVHKSKAKAAQTRRGLLYALPDWLMIRGCGRFLGDSHAAIPWL